jgi:diguanylate cyclase (GGDEF)-like protein
MKNRLSSRQQELTKSDLRAELEEAQRRIESLERENKNLKVEIERSGFDPLTGLEESKRRIEEVDRIIYAHRPRSLRDRREKSAVCVMIADIDKFKDINDTFGHSIGDEVLLHVGIYLRGKVRNQLDRVQRYRGDEFLLVFSGVTASEVILRFRDGTDPAHRPRLSFQTTITLRNNVGEVSGEKTISIALSGGLADCDVTKDPMISRIEAIERADRAMYESKKCNKIVLSMEYLAPDD